MASETAAKIEPLIVAGYQLQVKFRDPADRDHLATKYYTLADPKLKFSSLTKFLDIPRENEKLNLDDFIKTAKAAFNMLIEVSLLDISGKLKDISDKEKINYAHLKNQEFKDGMTYGVSHKVVIVGEYKDYFITVPHQDSGIYGEQILYPLVNLLPKSSIDNMQ